MIVLPCGKHTFVSLPVSPPIYRSKSAKFQLSTTARSIIIFMRTALPYLWSVFLFLLNLEAEITLNVLFNTLKNNTTQYAKKNKKKRKNNVWTFTTIFAVGHPSCSFNPDRQGLTWVPLPNRVSRGYCEIRISSIPNMLFYYSVEILVTVRRNFTIYFLTSLSAFYEYLFCDLHDNDDRLHPKNW